MFKEIISREKAKAQLQSSRGISYRMATRLENLRTVCNFSISIKKKSQHMNSFFSIQP
jgi:hypothetical protein